MRLRAFLVTATLPCVLLSLDCRAGVPLYDFKQVQRDGVVLVGMECQHRTRTLELGLFFSNHPPQKRMDLWQTSDLVKFDAHTFMLTDVLTVEKRCEVEDARDRVEFTGVPGATNAMWMCGAGNGAHASVWKNDKLVFDEDLYRCSRDGYIKKVTFRIGVDAPEIERQE
jgi:hypothetical protein